MCASARSAVDENGISTASVVCALVPVDPILNRSRPDCGSHITNDLTVVFGQPITSHLVVVNQ
jgi:hypothetical protein